jgi:hypothetical protein
VIVSTTGRSGAAVLLTAFALLTLLALPAIAQAHGHRDVGDYRLTVGFFVEPAFEGLMNGVDLRVQQDGEPVTGVETTLEVEVRHGDASMVLPLRAVWGQPGRYTADFVPTAVGEYTFRFFGRIESLEIDESFTSTADNFNSVQSIAERQFPLQAPSPRELEAAISGAVSTATEAGDSVSAAEMRANLALAVGVLGLLAGGGGLVLGLRRRG